ncbi:MarR family winged helix-turn-helix transcriptional regulator [Pyxidicoccus xibeiensis]|uniref:MarR family winged helix-turn-helix transcriptional regulator n=1 Tax=Pyxidicoccus xibeiensis TaxID=2906759 RepID=UPI0020A7C032|nr:MarR family transcriptional regulator [Pyxidicoccus xibeiensis]MCP3140789.1 MarR family transcriptional regulator [Pyxidicoccus xibeiensis]
MTLPEQLGSLRRALRRLLTERLGEQTGRPFMQLLALKVIAGGARSQVSLADGLSVDPPAVSRLVDRLEEDGLVNRLAGENRRCVRLELTDKGQVELELMRSALQWADGELTRYLSASEVVELKRLLEKLQAGLSQGESPATSGRCAGE